jgi:hypothetical protein
MSTSILMGAKISKAWLLPNIARTPPLKNIAANALIFLP